MRKIVSKRLWLIPASPDSMRAELKSPRTLARYLDVRMPKAWPPPLNDEASQRWMLDYLEKHPHSRYGMYYIVLKDGQLVGNCGFKGEPVKGAVELGYAIAPEFQRRGYASEAVLAMLKYAFAHRSVNRVLAETLPDLVASIGVLRKADFVRVRGGSEPGVLRFSHTRARWESPA